MSILTIKRSLHDPFSVIFLKTYLMLTWDLSFPNDSKESVSFWVSVFLLPDSLFLFQSSHCSWTGKHCPLRHNVSTKNVCNCGRYPLYFTNSDVCLTLSSDKLLNIFFLITKTVYLVSHQYIVKVYGGDYLMVNINRRNDNNKTCLEITIRGSSEPLIVISRLTWTFLNQSFK